MGRFSLGFAFFALAGAFFPCFGRDFFFFFFGFLGAFGSWDSGDSWQGPARLPAPRRVPPAGRAASRWFPSLPERAAPPVPRRVPGRGQFRVPAVQDSFSFWAFSASVFWACGKRGSPGRLPRRLPRPRSTAWQRRYPPARLRVPAHSAGFEGSYFLPSWGILLPCVLTQLSIIAKIYGFVQPGAFGWSQGRTADAASIPPWAGDFLLLL